MFKKARLLETEDDPKLNPFKKAVSTKRKLSSSSSEESESSEDQQPSPPKVKKPLTKEGYIYKKKSKVLISAWNKRYLGLEGNQRIIYSEESKK